MNHVCALLRGVEQPRLVSLTLNCFHLFHNLKNTAPCLLIPNPWRVNEIDLALLRIGSRTTGLEEGLSELEREIHLIERRCVLIITYCYERCLLAAQNLRRIIVCRFDGEGWPH